MSTNCSFAFLETDMVNSTYFYAFSNKRVNDCKGHNYYSFEEMWLNFKKIKGKILEDDLINNLLLGLQVHHLP